MSDRSCSVCGQPFTINEWDDRHWPHDPDCVHNLDPALWVGCDCDYEVHPRCCWECTPQ